MDEQVKTISADDVYQIMRHGTAEERYALLDALPENIFKASARPLMASDNLGMSLVAMGSLVLNYCNGQSPAIGAELASGLHRLAVELYLSDEGHAGLLATTLTNLAYAYVTALNLQGRSREVIDFTDTWIPFYTETVPEPQNVSSLHVARAGALFNLNEIDVAEAVLSNEDVPWSAEASIERSRLQNRIARLKGGVTSMTEPETDDVGKVIADALKRMAQAAGGNEVMGQLGKRLAEEGGFKPPQNKQEFEAMEGLLSAGESFMTRGKDEDNEWSMQQRLRKASGLFYLQEHPDETSIRHSMAELEAVLAWAERNGHNEIKNDALWGLYLCHSRLQDASAAADYLIALRRNIENVRAGIADPFERGGAFSTYPNLFSMLCEKLHTAGRYAEMLESIEAAKGRAIADLLTRSGDRIASDAEFYSAVSALNSLTARHRFHYLSWFVDEYEGVSTVYAVLMDKQGALHSAPPIQMQSEALRQAILHLEPRLWNRPDVLNPSLKTPQANTLLAPLAEVFSGLIEQGVLQQGDQLVISGDSHLSNIPWYYLPLAKGELIDWFSVSRVHNVYHLNGLLQQAPLQPQHMLGAILPKQEDREKSFWPSFHEHLCEPIRYLNEEIGLSADAILEDTEVSLDNLRRGLSPQQLVHISTHGYFPGLDSPKNPYHSSGLFISDGQSMPTDSCAASGACILTPEQVVQQQLDFDGCHVSMMACVSGLSREGLGGDALGMDWALIQAGARSLLSAHWHVNASEASRFFTSFYRSWYQEGKSRGEAARLACLELKNSDTGYEWAAFGLSGDWR